MADKRGGRRKGAGRKPGAPKHKHTFSVDLSVWSTLKRTLTTKEINTYLNARINELNQEINRL